MLALDALERVKKLVQADAVFEVCEQGIHWDSRMDEAGRAAQPLWVAPNRQAIWPCLEHAFILPRQSRRNTRRLAGGDRGGSLAYLRSAGWTLGPSCADSFVGVTSIQKSSRHSALAVQSLARTQTLATPVPTNSASSDSATPPRKSDHELRPRSTKVIPPILDGFVDGDCALRAHHGSKCVHNAREVPWNTYCL